jgi:hypothetical protein
VALGLQFPDGGFVLIVSGDSDILEVQGYKVVVLFPDRKTAVAKFLKYGSIITLFFGVAMLSSPPLFYFLGLSNHHQLIDDAIVTLAFLPDFVELVPGFHFHRYVYPSWHILFTS